MSDQLQSVLSRLASAKEARGELSRIAHETGISYRTIYGMMNGQQTPTATTVGKLAAFFKRDDRRAKP